MAEYSPEELETLAKDEVVRRLGKKGYTLTPAEQVYVDLGISAGLWASTQEKETVDG